MSDYLFFIHHAYGAEILSFVLMDNHFHLIAKFPENNMAEATQYFMRETSRSIARRSRRLNHVYGGRIFRSRIQSEQYLYHAYKYVYRNPVEANLAGGAEDYRYSTLRGKLGLERLTIPICEDVVLFSNETASILNWLNDRPVEKDFHDLGKALRRREMRFAPTKSRKPHRLETGRY